MKRKVKLTDLCCANCAAKIEEKVSQLPGVEMVSVNFLTEKMILEVKDSEWERVQAEIVKIVRKIEPDVTVVFL